MTQLRIGLLTDSAQKQQYLKILVQQAGHLVACNLMLPTASTPQTANNVDAWISDLVETENAALDHLLESVTAPVILSDSSEYHPGSGEHSAWLRRMTLRIERLSGEINLRERKKAPYLWILAASTGGPAAVKEFLGHLPADLGIAFIYVQHIDANYSATLIRMMSGAGSYPASLAHQGSVLQRDTITLIHADQRLEICDNGTLSISDQPWGGCYAPSVDQVAANAARIYREYSGLIIFTGMGDDGAASSRLIKQQGGQVWAQTPESCTSSSMPEAALATGCVSYCGTPKELALQLAMFSHQRMPNNQHEGKRSYESTTTTRI